MGADILRTRFCARYYATVSLRRASTSLQLSNRHEVKCLLLFCSDLATRLDSKSTSKNRLLDKIPRYYDSMRSTMIHYPRLSISSSSSLAPNHPNKLENTAEHRQGPLQHLLWRFDGLFVSSVSLDLLNIDWASIVTGSWGTAGTAPKTVSSWAWSKVFRRLLLLAFLFRLSISTLARSTLLLHLASSSRATRTRISAASISTPCQSICSKASSARSTKRCEITQLSCRAL